MKIIELTENQHKKLMADKARLDWLLYYIQLHGTDGMLKVWGYSKGGPLGRDAIDGAIADMPNNQAQRPGAAGFAEATG
jgi:hypothetical protein